MQISPEQGAFMQLFAAAIAVRRAIEIGVFTGYSSISVARALPADGKLVALDVSPEWTDIAREFWDKAAVADRIELRLGPGEQSLRAMLDDGEAGSYDFAFVDADKEGYPVYYELCLELLRPGGVVAFDNAFMGGVVVAPGPDDPAARTMNELNARVFADTRVDASLVPVADGLLLARKRASP